MRTVGALSAADGDAYTESMRRCLFVVVVLVACTGARRELALQPLDGSAVRATAHLAEVFGKSGWVITARMEVDDPAGRALRGALVEGRCASVGNYVDTIQISSVTGHLGGASPTTLAALEGTHAVALFAEGGSSGDAPREPIACRDL